MLKEQILERIGNLPVTKDKNAKCAELIQRLITELPPGQQELFWEIENAIVDYNIFIQDEIFRQLLADRNCE